MNNIFIKSFIIFFLFAFNANSETINKIEISGNKRISKETILVLGNIKINEDFTNSKLNNSLKELYKTNFFSDIKISQNNNILKIKIIENPIIEEVIITGIKKNSFKDVIYESLTLKNRKSFTQNQLTKDIELINPPPTEKLLFLIFLIFLICLKINSHKSSMCKTSLI